MTRRLTEEKINNDFIIGVKEVFGENLAFGFVCGGFAKGYWDDNHDIDMFICVKNPIDKETAIKYLEWYYNLHKNHNFPPDCDYPGEIVELDVLQKRLSLLPTLKLELKVIDMNIREAILWADMLAGGKLEPVCNEVDIFNSLQTTYVNYPEKWKKEVLSLVSQKEKLDWQDKDYGLIMEKFMQYPKSDAREFYKKYDIQDFT
jgi:Fe-S cluster biosynthesis and repair protein YggX